MTFNKEKYWRARNNTQLVSSDKTIVYEILNYKIKNQEYATLEEAQKAKGKKDEIKAIIKKPLRGQGVVPAPVVLPNTKSKAEVGFSLNGKMVYKNRAYRRQRIKLPNTGVNKEDRNRSIRKRKNKIARKRKY